MSETKTCSSCRFWQKAGTGVDNIPGICRRNSPQGAILRNPPGPRTDTQLIWPGTSSSEWCGDHETTGFTNPTIHVMDAAQS